MVFVLIVLVVVVVVVGTVEKYVVSSSDDGSSSNCGDGCEYCAGSNEMLSSRYRPTPGSFSRYEFQPST